MSTATRIIATGRYSYNGQPANISEVINAASLESAREVAASMFARYEAHGYVVTDKRLTDAATGQPVLGADQEALAAEQAATWALFAEYVDPAAAMASSESEFLALPLDERLQAARESIAYNQ